MEWRFTGQSECEMATETVFSSSCESENREVECSRRNGRAAI